MANTNIINAVFGSGLCAVTTSAFRANYGMVLRFSGIDLPTAFEVDFSNYDVMGRDSITMIGQNNEVQIPDDLWDSGLNIYAYVYLHPTDDSGVTVYTVTIPVLGRPNRTEEEPTPHEQSVIEQAISALNEAVEATAADVETTTANAQAAAQSEANAATSERSAAASAGAALASQNAAESASQSATELASGAAESARNAALSASTAAESATNAQESAEQAERSAQSIGDDVERAERAATTATEKATAASGSAATASTKATEAAQSASFAAAWAANAADLASDAQDYAIDAEQAKQDAQDAQTAAETAQGAAEAAAQSVSASAAQIAQNTADIANLVLSKAGALVDTVSGSIASFTPDSTVPTVRGLTVDIEPVQDLHGYDNPWPAGGGKNKLPVTLTTITNSGVTFTVNDDGTISTSGTATADINQTINASTVLISGESYKIAGCAPGGNGSNYFIRSTRGIVAGATTADFGGSAMATNEPLYVFIHIASGVNTNGLVFKPMICLTTETDATFAPYSNICPISGWDSVDVPRTAINVWDEEMESGRISAVGQPSVEASWIRTKNFISIKPNTAYYRVSPNNIQLFWYDEEQNFISYANWGKGAITSPSNARYMKFHVDPAYGTIYNHDISINYPSTDTAYHSGTDNTTYTITLGQTVYGGKLNVTGGKMVVDRAEVDLGTLNWEYQQSSGTFYAPLANTKTWSGSVLPNYLCDRYSISIWNGFSKRDKVIGNPAGAKQVRIRDTAYTDKSTFKESLNGAQLVYELATPITVDLTPIEVAVLTGQTNNVWADSGDVTVEYAADLKTYIDNKIAAAVAALS